MQTFLVTSAAGARRDLTRGAREQDHWNEHAAFINSLVEDGFMFLGGPLVDEGGAVIAVQANDEDAVRTTLAADPWYQHGILELVSIKRWQIFVDERAQSA